MTTQQSAGVNAQEAVAASADAAGQFAAAPALLLELSEALGRLAADAGRLTDRGRRPFRPDGGWPDALGTLAYRMYLLADQTGVDLDAAVRGVADGVLRASQAQAAAQSVADDDAWPLRD